MTASAASTAAQNAKEYARAVAEEIRRQLGPMCLAMLGAHTLLAHTCPGNDPALSLKIQGSETVNYLKISLTPMDVYRVEFGFIGGPSQDFEYRVVQLIEGAHAEDLHRLIERHTGLYTSL